MSNEFIKQQEEEVRNSLPSLMTVGANRNIEQPRTDLTGQIANIYKDMAKRAGEQKKKLDTSDYNRQIREANRQFVEGMTALPPGWANSPEGLSQYDKLIETKIKEKKRITDEFKFKLGKDMYDESTLKISEDATQDLYNASNMRNQTILQENTVRKSTNLGNLKSDINGVFAVSDLRKTALGEPVHLANQKEVDEVNALINDNVQNILSDANTTEAQKIQELRSVITDREDGAMDYWYKKIVDGKNPDFQLRVDDVEQFNPVTGLPVMDERIVAEHVMEGLNLQEADFKSGAFKEQLIKDHKFSEAQAEVITNDLYGRFTQVKNAKIKELEMRAAKADEAAEERKRYAQQKTFEAHQKGYNEMGKNFTTKEKLAGAFAVYHNAPFDPAFAFKKDTETGKSKFEDLFEISEETLNRYDMFVDDMFGPKHIENIKNAASSEKVGEYLVNNLLKDIEPGSAAEELTLKSLAHTMEAAEIPITYSALKELAVRNPEGKDDTKRSILSSIVSYEKNPFDKNFPKRAYSSAALSNAEIVLKKHVGGDVGMNILLAHVEANRASLESASPKFSAYAKKSIKEGGKVSKNEYQMAIVSAYHEDKIFRDEIDKITTAISELSGKNVGVPYSAGIDQIEMLKQKNAKRKAYETEKDMERYGIKGKKFNYSTVTGKLN